MLPPEVVEAFQTAPGGVLAGRDLRRFGVDRRHLSRWARDGLLDRLLHGMYALAGGGADVAGRTLHLALRYLDLRTPADRPPAAVTGTAGLAWEGTAQLAMPQTPLILVHADCRARADHLPFRTTRTSDPITGSRHVRSLRLADIGRRIADAALEPQVTDLTLRLVVDDVRNRRLATGPALVRRWKELRHEGARRMLTLTATGCFEQESEGERRAFRTLFLGRGPLPDCQVVVRGRRRVDFAYLSAGLVMEYYGDPHRDTVDADAVRVDEVETDGLRVKVITKSMLARDADRVGANIQNLRRHREHLVDIGALVLPPLPPQPERLTPLRTLRPFG